jgi:hypothetical protein
VNKICNCHNGGRNLLINFTLISNEVQRISHIRISSCADHTFGSVFEDVLCVPFVLSSVPLGSLSVFISVDKQQQN